MVWTLVVVLALVGFDVVLALVGFDVVLLTELVLFVVECVVEADVLVDVFDVVVAELHDPSSAVPYPQ